MSDVTVPVNAGRSPLIRVPPDASPAELRTVVIRLAGAVALVVICYGTSLWTILRGITVDTPLAHLGLVPLVAFGVMLARARPRPEEPSIHDRLVDRIVAVPFLVAALACLVLLPARMSTMYWLYRIDVLTLPLFVAGVIALLFGSRLLWRVRAGVVLLLLAWPVPFRWLVTTFLEPLTNLTAQAVSVVVGFVPLARPVVGDGVAFSVPHRAGAFQVQIASACSGANGLLGFLLVAGALTLVLRGSRWAKVAWLATGAALVLVLNVVRILAILGVGRWLGQTASVEVLHPMVGLVAFSVGVLVMVLVSGRFGLTLPVGRGPSRTRAVMDAVPSLSRPLAVGLVVLSVVGGSFDRGLTAYDPIASSIGTPRLVPFSRVGTRTEGWYGEPILSFQEGRRFFGEDSTWVRYSYSGPGVPGLRSDVPVLADVITASDVQSFSDFGLEACYRFHGYGADVVRQVALGNGVVGTVLGWTETGRNIHWTGVYWIWPVRSGDSVRYERIVMMLPESRGAEFEAPSLTSDASSSVALKADELVRGSGDGRLSRREQARRAFLVTFARRVITSATEQSAKLPHPKEVGG